MPDPDQINGFVLAGGKSRRMGQDKGLMRLGDQPLVRRAAEILRPVVHTVTLLASPERYGNLGFPVVPDRWPERGPLAALCTGLLVSDAEWNLFLACDLPRVSGKLIELLVARIRTARAGAVVPRTSVGWQPLCAGYHARCRAAFELAIRQDRLSIVELFEELHPEAVTSGEMATAGVTETEFVNINTPQEWGQLAHPGNESR